MTARADRLTKRAKTPDQGGSGRSSYLASSVRVFVDALERLDYRIEPLLANAGIRRADLDDPDARISSARGSRVLRAISVSPKLDPFPAFARKRIPFECYSSVVTPRSRLSSP
jgi:hypothetical protein